MNFENKAHQFYSCSCSFKGLCTKQFDINKVNVAQNLTCIISRFICFKPLIILFSNQYILDVGNTLLKSNVSNSFVFKKRITILFRQFMETLNWCDGEYIML